MENPRSFLREFGICQDGLNIQFSELPSGNVQMYMLPERLRYDSVGGITELSPESCRRLARWLMEAYDRIRNGEEAT